MSTSCPGRIRLGSDGPRVPPTLAGNSGSGPMARGVDQVSRATQAHVPGPKESTSCTMFSGQGPRSCSVDENSQANRARVRGPVVSTSCPGGFAPVSDCPECRQALHCPRAREVDQLSQATRTQFRGPAASPGSQGRHAPGSDRPQGAPAVPGDSGQCPSARDVDRPCWVTPARV